MKRRKRGSKKESAKPKGKKLMPCSNPRLYKGISIFLCLIYMISYGVLGLSCLPEARAAQGGEAVTIKILAVNPTNQDLDTVITHRLPPEVLPEDVLDSSGMQIRYDTNLVSYYLSSSVVLAPKETRTINIRVRNVWHVDAEYIEGIRLKLRQTVNSLDTTRYYDTAKRLLEKAMAQIERIEQEESRKRTIQKQIEAYRSHMKQLKQIETGMLSLSALRKLSVQDEGGVRTAKFIIRAKNPAPERMTMTVKAILPKEITSFDVLNPLDFTLLFEKDQGRFYVEKEDIFEPGEEKKYEIILRDVWYITKAELDFLRDQAEKLRGMFGATPYRDFAEQTVDSIVEILDAVWNLQSEVQDSEAIEDRIRAYVINHQRVELVKKKIKELQDLLLEIPQQKPTTEIDQIKESITEMSKMFEILSLGFTPDLSTTWWIILGIIAFLFIFATSFYVTWMLELTKSKFGKIERAV